MKSWFKQIFATVGGPSAAPVIEPARRAARPAAAAATPSRSAVPARADSAQAVAVGVGARRPLLAADGRVAGFEFRLHERMRARLDPRTDRVACAAHAAALVASARSIAQAGSRGLARLPLSWALGIDAGQVSPGLMLGLEAQPSADPDPAAMMAIAPVVAALRAAGAQVGWAPQTRSALRPDFVLLRAGSPGIASTLAERGAWPQALQHLPVVATDLSDLAEIELALGHGVHLVCGALTGGAGAAEAKDRLPLPPDARRLGQLLSQLVAGAETALIVDQIKADVSLSVRLISRLNTAAFAHLHKDGGIDQMVLWLGRNELYRWLSVLLMQYMGKRQAGSGLQQVALWRARMMELLAAARQEAAPSELFTLGLASMLGLLLQAADAEVANTLCLGEQGRRALLDHAGPWAGYLTLVVALESGDLPDDAFVSALGGTAAIEALSDQAWSWVKANSADA